MASITVIFDPMYDIMTTTHGTNTPPVVSPIINAMDSTNPPSPGFTRPSSPVNPYIPRPLPAPNIYGPWSEIHPNICGPGNAERVARRKLYLDKWYKDARIGNRSTEEILWVIRNNEDRLAKLRENLERRPTTNDERWLQTLQRRDMTILKKTISLDWEEIKKNNEKK